MARPDSTQGYKSFITQCRLFNLFLNSPLVNPMLVRPHPNVLPLAALDPHVLHDVQARNDRSATPGDDARVQSPRGRQDVDGRGDAGLPLFPDGGYAGGYIPSARVSTLLSGVTHRHFSAAGRPWISAVPPSTSIALPSAGPLPSAANKLEQTAVSSGMLLES